MNLMLADLELTLTAYSAHRTRKFQANPILIQEIDKAPPPAPLCPRGKLHLHVTSKAPVGNTPSSGISIARLPGANEGASLPNAAGGVASPQQPKLAAPALSSTTAASLPSLGAVNSSPTPLTKDVLLKNISAEDGRSGYPSRGHGTSNQDGSGETYFCI